MKNLFAAYRDFSAKRALYRRTRDELARLSPAEANDLGIAPADASRIAREAVWG
jgi:uncharacterized protein YjiS (DUF1127 family)